MYYIDQFIGLKSAPLLLSMKLFPNAKEISESMSALTATRGLLGASSFGDSSLSMYDIGSGHTPRTAALFACTTRWNCFAVDPQLKEKGAWTKIERLNLFHARVEDLLVKKENDIILVGVHCHIQPAEILKYFNAPKIYMVLIECCYKLSMPTPPEQYKIIDYNEFEDEHCLSKKNLVKVWTLERGLLGGGGFKEE